jgi:signal peptidase I
MGALLTSIAVLAVLAAQESGPKYNRGDEVRVQTADSRPASPPVQRVIAVPGDQIKIDSKALAVNGRIVTDVSPKLLSVCDSWDQSVPAGHYLLVGEEIRGSSISRSCSLLPASRLLGAARR